MKKAIVTGGTSGVGLSIVKQLAKNNFDVVFIGTNVSKGNEIEKELNLSNNTKNKFIQLDLSDLSLVKLFIADFKQENSSLDLLVNVAGVMLLKQKLSNKGLDKTFAIGYLSAFILSTELVSLLENGKNARIVNVSGSPSHVLPENLDFNNLDFKKKYSGFKTAIATVHAKTVLTQILAEKLQAKNIDVNAFHPGTVRSDLSRNMPFILRILAKLVSPLMSKESKNGIYVCLSNDINGTTGKLFVNKKPFQLNFKKEYRNLLWKNTEKLISS